MNEDLKSLIDKASAKSVSAQLEAIQRKRDDVRCMYEEALEINDEVRDILDLVNYAISKGYRVQNYNHNGGDMRDKDAPRLCTDGINHGLGLYGKPLLRIIDTSFHFSYIGIANEGCNGDYDLICNGSDVFWGNNAHFVSFSQYDPTNRFWNRAGVCLAEYLNKFQSFKGKVMEFINNIDSYKCFM